MQRTLARFGICRQGKGQWCLILFSAYAPSSKIANSGRFNGKSCTLCYLPEMLCFALKYLFFKLLHFIGRITINGTMSQFSCKLSVRSGLWDARPRIKVSNRSASTRSRKILKPISANSINGSATVYYDQNPVPPS